MICFKPDGSILCKVNICLCADCMLGNFLECSIELGKLFYAVLISYLDFSPLEYIILD